MWNPSETRTWHDKNIELIAILILPNISRSKDDPTIKFGQLIEYNIENTFIEKTNTKGDRAAIPRPIFKKSKIEHISESIIWSFTKFVFIVCQVEGYQNRLKLSCRPLPFTWYKALLENKKRSETEKVSLPHFLHDFCRNISLLYINWENFNVWLSCQYIVKNCVLTMLWHKFWN